MPLSNVNPQQYQQQLNDKVAHIQQLFEDLNPPAFEIYESIPLHYRMRAEFRIWHQEDDCYYAMFKSDAPKTPYRIDAFPIAHPAIADLMTKLMAAIKPSNTLKQRLFQIEFLSTLNNEVLVTLIYHKRLDDDWEQQAKALEDSFDIHIIGRSRKQRIVLSQDYVTETLTVNQQTYHSQQVENSFTQPNAYINQKMLGWALQHSKDNGNDLLELYCGNGNFTCVLAQNFNQVLATEIAKTSVKSALFNFKKNNINTVAIARMSSEELTSALNKEREFRRLKDIDLDSYNFSTILVDPPRAGLDQATEKLASRFEHIIYISCNPITLHKNLLSLTKTHTIEHCAVFDQFPYTHHAECGVILTRKSV